MSTRKNKIFKGMLLSYFTTIVVLCSFAALFALTQVSDSYAPLIVKITTLVSVALGALTSSKNIHSKGWLNGSIIGILYTLSLFAISIWGTKCFFPTVKFIQTLSINTIVGIFCGVVGINTGSTKK